MEDSLNFCGEFYRTLDAKNRIVMPPKLKEVFNEDEEFIVVCFPKDKYLSVYTKEVFNTLASETLFLNDGVNREKLQRYVYSRMDKCSLDSQSRFVIKPSLAALAGITRDVKMIGIGKRIELWDPAEYERDLEDFDPESIYRPY